MASETCSSTLSPGDTHYVQHNCYYDVPVSSNESPLKKPSVWRKSWQWIKPVYILEHLDYKSLKVILPTFIQVWVTVIVATVPRTGEWVGNASYLMQILGFILSVGGLSVGINIILAFACFTSMIIGWLFVVVAHVIGTKIRGWTTQDELAESLIREGTCTAETIVKCMREQIFTGRYLDAKVSVVFAVALVTGIMFFGTVSRVHKMARLVYVCGCISIIINTCFTVFFPVFLPLEIGLVVIKPAGIAFAVKILVACLVFPFTSNWKYFDVATQIMSSMLDISKRNERFFSSMKPSEDSFANYEGLSKDIQGSRTKLSIIDIFLGSTRFEVSFGRFSCNDAYEFSSRMKALLNTYSGYEYFYVSLQERKDLMKDVFYSRGRHPTISGTNEDDSGQSKLYTAFSHTYKEVGKLEESRVQDLFKKKYLDENRKPSCLKDLDVVAGHIRDAHACYLSALSCALEVARDWVADANEFRTYALLNYKAHSERQQRRHDEVVRAYLSLQEFLAAHEAVQNELSIKMLYGMQGHEQILSLISQTSFFLFLSKQVANQTLSLLEFLMSIDKKRPRPVFIWPWRKTTKDKIIDDRTQEKGEPSRKVKMHPRDPDTLSPQTPLQIFMWSMCKVYNTLLREDYSYWFHCGILVNFCAFPFYFKNSADFFYRHKLVWFPVMCAVSTAQYSADSVYMFVTKVVYTLIGAVAGMVAWYISAGSGSGNYYGYAAVCAVLYLFVSFYRHFSVHTLPIAAIMMTITPTLVLGTSWTDSQYDASDLGWGWRVAVVRFVSVLAGLAVAFTTTFFPRVRSSKAALRKKLAATLESLVGLQNQVCNFALHRYDNQDIHISVVGDKLLNDIRALLFRLAAIKGSIKTIKYEIPLTGPWPTEKYERLHALVVSITQLYFLHYRLLDQVEDTETWIPHMVNRAAWNQQEFLSSVVSLTYMASESLKLKIPIPEITTATLSIKHLEVLSEMWGTEEISLNERLYETRDGDSQQLRRRPLKSLDFESLLSHDGRLNVVALLITHLIYKQIDQAVLLVKSLVGEKYHFDSRMFEL